MLTSDEDPQKRTNAHAHVEARARMGCHLSAVPESQCPCWCPVFSTVSPAASGANLPLAKITEATLPSQHLTAVV